MKEHQNFGNSCVSWVPTTAKTGDYFIHLVLELVWNLKAQTMEMAFEDEWNNAYESLKKAEMKELSVPAIFQKILMMLLCCVISTRNHCSWLAVFHSCICSKSNMSARFFEVAQEFSKSRGSSWKLICQKCLANIWFTVNGENILGWKNRYVDYSETVPKSWL